MKKERNRPSGRKYEVENEQLRQRVEELARQVARLGRELKEARRQQKRQAAPFFRGKPKADLARAGRPVYVPLSVSDCPACGERLGSPMKQSQYQVEIPRIEAFVTPLDVEVASCTGCGYQARGGVLGTATVQVKPDVLASALAAALKRGNKSKVNTKPMKSLYGDCLLRVDEVAGRLGMTVAGIRRAIFEGRLEVVRLSRRCVRIRESYLNQWIESKVYPAKDN